MPRENKKRGRRDELKKRKRDADEAEADPKRHKTSHEESEHAFEQIPFAGDELVNGVALARPEAMPFFGMLDDDEQEYFRSADEMLELNRFEDQEARDLFLESVYKEASGKELRIAHSQSCSRLMERLILLSSTKQLKNLFQSFSGQFVHLVQHRFASHCCEALFIRAAPIVTRETSKPESLYTPPSSDPSDIFVSMENLFLSMLDELEGYLGFLMTDRFASHVLRVLLVILAGTSLDKDSNKSAFQSKKKEKVTVTGTDRNGEWSLPARAVPPSFRTALEKIIHDSVANLDTTYLRILATHPTGNPTLQLLLKTELTQFGKARAKDESSISHRLLPDDPIVEGTESASFINGLMYDRIGSRLLETIIEYAPGKMFKVIYAEFIKARIASLARNEIAGYVAAKVLERLGKDDLQDAMAALLEHMQSLLERNRTSIIKTLIERCAARELDTTPIATQLEAAYGGSNGFDVTRILNLSEANDEVKPVEKHDSHSPDKIHGSLLAQAMMQVPGPLAQLIFDSLAKLGVQLTLRIARDPAASRTLQAALTSPNAQIIDRRKIIQQLYGHVGELAMDPAGSHVIDAVWEGTRGLAFIRERIAEELSENEASLRESLVGRAVWRNWHMDLYRRRRADWVNQALSTAGNTGFQSFPGPNGDVTPPSQSQRASRHMSAIELARRRHAENKFAELKRESSKQTFNGDNAVKDLPDANRQRIKRKEKKSKKRHREHGRSVSIDAPST